MRKRDWGAESNGKLPHLIILGKTAALVPDFAVEDLSSAELQAWFLRLQWRICPWAEHSDDDDDADDDVDPGLITIFYSVITSGSYKRRWKSSLLHFLRETVPRNLHLYILYEFVIQI